MEPHLTEGLDAFLLSVCSSCGHCGSVPQLCRTLSSSEGCAGASSYYWAGSSGGGLDGRAWNEIKDLPLPWFSGLAILLDMVEATGNWPHGLLDAFLP